MKVESLSRAAGGAGSQRLLPPSLKGSGAGGVRFLLPFVLLASAACSVVTPAVSATAAPTSPPPLVSLLAGHYGCAGYEFGMLTAAGELMLNANGVADFRDYYGHEQTGTWTPGSQPNELLFQGMDLLSATYDAPNHRLEVGLKPDSKITHTETHSMECTPISPPSTATP